MLISTFGYLVYVVVVRLFDVSGWAALFPQAVGMVAGGLILTFRHKPFNFYVIKNIIPGLIWAAGNMFLFISQPRVGVATSFSLSQMGIVISTLGGIILLGEKENKAAADRYRHRHHTDRRSRRFAGHRKSLRTASKAVIRLLTKSQN